FRGFLNRRPPVRVRLGAPISPSDSATYPYALGELISSADETRRRLALTGRGRASIMGRRLRTSRYGELVRCKVAVPSGPIGSRSRGSTLRTSRKPDHVTSAR